MSLNLQRAQQQSWQHLSYMMDEINNKWLIVSSNLIVFTVITNLIVTFLKASAGKNGGQTMNDVFWMIIHVLFCLPAWITAFLLSPV